MRVRVWASAGLLAAGAAVACGSSGSVASSNGAGGAGGAITGAGGGHTTSGGHTTGTSATTSSSSGATTSSSTGTGSGPTCPATPPIEGPGITGPDHQWTWIPIAGSKCLDGSQAGFGFRPSSTSKKLYIYLEGGGACFNP